MDEKQIIDSAKLFIETLFVDDYSGHDVEHSLRVYNNARVFLEKYHINKRQIKEICEIINSVSFSKNRGTCPKTIEGKIVQDADRLDAIGAIGIARTFAYGGSHGRPIKDSIKHFDDKLLLLKNEMNTEEGKKIAKTRHDFLELYINEIRYETNVER